MYNIKSALQKISAVWPRLVAMLCAASLSLAAVAFVGTFATDLPQSDDWGMVLDLAKGVDNVLAWCLEPVCDHYIPLQKVLAWSLWTLHPGTLRLPLLMAAIDRPRYCHAGAVLDRLEV